MMGRDSFLYNSLSRSFKYDLSWLKPIANVRAMAVKEKHDSDTKPKGNQSRTNHN